MDKISSQTYLSQDRYRGPLRHLTSLVSKLQMFYFLKLTPNFKWHIEVRADVMLEYTITGITMYFSMTLSGG